MRLTLSHLSLFLLLCGTPLSDGLSNASDDNVIFRQDINLGGNNLGPIEVRLGEEPADAVYTFSRRHGLAEHERSVLLDEVCGSVPCARRQALLWTADVADRNLGFSGKFELFDGEEPVDQAHVFAWRNGLAAEHRDAILVRACEVVGCHRAEPGELRGTRILAINTYEVVFVLNKAENAVVVSRVSSIILRTYISSILFRDPVIWRKQFNVEGNLVEVVIKEGEEAADIIFATLQPLGVPLSERMKVMDTAKSSGVPHTREFALAFSKVIKMEDGSFQSMLNVFDDGIEPVDKLYEFAVENRVEDRFGQISSSVLPHLCALLHCQRAVPVVWSKVIRNENEAAIGHLNILKNEEPIDAVDSFVQSLGLNPVDNKDFFVYRNSIFKAACEELICTRTTPIVYQKDIKDENEMPLGTFNILESEEVVDAVVRFTNEIQADFDHTALTKYFLDNVCEFSRVSCTKNLTR